MPTNDILTDEDVDDLRTRTYRPGQRVAVNAPSTMDTWQGCWARVVSGRPLKELLVMYDLEGLKWTVLPDRARGTITRQLYRGQAGYDVAFPFLAENGENLVVRLSSWNIEPVSDEEPEREEDGDDARE